MVLDSVTAEVSQKVKNAIKAKLNELGAYVDDELPDYIMILVGNRKTKDQMDDDLSLFLGHNTERFTSWLHDVLQRLNAASVLQKESKISKEKKKEDEEEKPQEPEETTKGVEEKKKHKKKKDKSEKKKEKKEKKKKKDKDKEKHSKSHKHKDRSKSKSKSPVEVITSETVGDVAQVGTTSDSKKAEDSIFNGSKITSTSEDVVAGEAKTSVQLKNDDLSSDVVNLRPNAEDLALGLEDEPPAKKIKTKLVSLELKDKGQGSPESPQLQTITNIEIQVDNPRAKEILTRSSSDDVATAEVSTSGVHERLGPKRVINLREESTFPPKSSGGEGIGRVVSSAIASAVKSVTLGSGTKSEAKTGKRLEARVRPLVSSRIKPAEEEEEVDDVALPPARLVSTVGAVLKRSHSNDNSDDDEPPSKRISGVASKVEVMPRPRRPGALQANTALILRAVADAHKSVNKPTRKVGEDKEEERGRKEIFSRSYQERQNQRLSSSVEVKPVKKFAITVPNALLKDSVEMKIAGKSSIETYVEEVDMDDDIQTEKQEGRLKSKIIPQTKSLATNKVIPMQVDETSGSTRFIVTLDGFGNEVTSTDLRSRIRGRPVRTPSVEEEEFIEEVEEWEEEVEEMEGVTPQAGPGPDRMTSAVGTVAPKWKAKIDASDLVTKKEERCRYWPACKEGAACQYIHPSKTCNTFPSCRFGDKCLYVHPNCKFDGACAKLNCPFTHTISRSLGLGNPTLKTKMPNPKAKVKCRYYPKCVDMNCPYMHPKQICRYGKACQTPSCLFVHPDVTTGSLLKWKAPKPADSKVSSSASTATAAV